MEPAAGHAGAGTSKLDCSITAARGSALLFIAAQSAFRRHDGLPPKVIRCPLLGPTRTSRDVRSPVAIGGKADIERPALNKVGTPSVGAGLGLMFSNTLPGDVFGAGFVLAAAAGLFVWAMGYSVRRPPPRP
jgi:hypothetical protein